MEKKNFYRIVVKSENELFVSAKSLEQAKIVPNNYFQKLIPEGSVHHVASKKLKAIGELIPGMKNLEYETLKDSFTGEVYLKLTIGTKIQLLDSSMKLMVNSITCIGISITGGYIILEKEDGSELVYRKSQDGLECSLIAVLRDAKVTGFDKTTKLLDVTHQTGVSGILSHEGDVHYCQTLNLLGL